MALMAFGKHGYVREAAAEIIRAVRDFDVPAEYATRALTRIGQAAPEVIPVLEEAAKDERVAPIVNEALKRIGQNATDRGPTNPASAPPAVDAPKQGAGNRDAQQEMQLAAANFNVMLIERDLRSVYAQIEQRPGVRDALRRNEPYNELKDQWTALAEGVADARGRTKNQASEAIARMDKRRAELKEKVAARRNELLEGFAAPDERVKIKELKEKLAEEKRQRDELKNAPADEPQTGAAAPDASGDSKSKKGEEPPAARAVAPTVRQDQEAVAYLRIAPAQSMTRDGKQPDAYEFTALKKTTMEYIKSKSLLTRALRDPAIAQLPVVKKQSDPVEWLQSELALSFPNDGETLMISMRGEETDQLEKIVNAVVDMYFKEVVDKGQDRAGKEEKLKQLVQEKSGQLVRELKEVQRLHESLGIVDVKDVGDRKSLLVTQLQHIEAEIHAIVLRSAALDAEINQHQTEIKRAVKEARAKVQTGKDEELQALQEKLADIKAEIADAPEDGRWQAESRLAAAQHISGGHRRENRQAPRGIAAAACRRPRAARDEGVERKAGDRRKAQAAPGRVAIRAQEIRRGHKEATRSAC